MIKLQELITVAPLSDEIRSQLLEGVTQLSPKRQQELSGICWDAILRQYQTNLNLTLQQESLQAATTQDATLVKSKAEVEDALILDLQKKFSAAGSSIQLSDVREELHRFQNKPQ